VEANTCLTYMRRHYNQVNVQLTGKHARIKVLTSHAQIMCFLIYTLLYNPYSWSFL